MEEPYGKAEATRSGPEPWRCGGNAVTQASVGVRAGWVWSRESLQGPGRRGCSRKPKASPAATSRLRPIASDGQAGIPYEVRCPELGTRNTVDGIRSHGIRSYGLTVARAMVGGQE